MLVNKDNFLHVMNTLRIPFIRDGVIEVEQINSTLALSEKPFENLSILDAGDDDILTIALAKFGGKIVRLEDVGVKFEIAKKYEVSDSTPANLTYLKEKLEDHCEHQPEKYDAVIASEVMKYVFNPISFLQQAIECLKPGGSIFITTADQTVASYVIALWFHERTLGIIPSAPTDHGRFMSPGRLTELLEKYGCSVKSIRGMKYNVFSRTMEWTDSTSIYYAVHAIKNV